MITISANTQFIKMRNTDKYVNNIFELDPSAVICLYKINLKEKGEYRFHAGENGFKKPIVLDGKEYDFFPISAQGFEVHGDGRLPRPRMAFTNHQGVISLRLEYFKNFINHKVTRIKTFVKYLDNVNFPKNVNPYTDPDPNVSCQEEIYFVNEKTQENDQIVEFELVSLLELQTATIPNRKVYSNNCPWQYRSTIGCKYNGKPISDSKNKRFCKTGYNKMSVGEDVYLEEQEASSYANEIDEWEIDKVYQKGDVVKITPFDFDPALQPVGIFTCINNDVESYPSRDRKNWVIDDCDKTLCGCRLRFSSDAADAGGCVRRGKGGSWTEEQDGLPFGGFPGVDPYDFSG